MGGHGMGCGGLWLTTFVLLSFDSPFLSVCVYTDGWMDGWMDGPMKRMDEENLFNLEAF